MVSCFVSPGQGPLSAPYPQHSLGYISVLSCHRCYLGVSRVGSPFCPLPPRHRVPSCQVSGRILKCFQGRVPCGPSSHPSPSRCLLAQHRVPQCPCSRDAEIPWRSPSSLVAETPQCPPARTRGRGSRAALAPRRGEGGGGGPSPLGSAPPRSGWDRRRRRVLLYRG